jgi:hypothetical protein
MERPLDSTKVDAPFLSFKDAQRETGEVLIEGAGTMEMTATEGGGLKRMDLKEINPYLRSLSRFPLQAAFRYHRQTSETPSLALSWVRFPDSGVLAAVAERAVITTLVTTEGRSLTEVKLIVKNQAQPFLKVDLPAGANILSAEVAGEKVKPVQAPDGSRVPMLRPGFRPRDSYEVSFVFMHSGAPFAKKGGSELSLPSMDVPISLLEWEVFLPEQYKVKDFGGDAIAANLLPPVMWATQVTNAYVYANAAPENGRVDALGRINSGIVGGGALVPGQLGGVITDPQGAAIPGANVKVSTDNGTTRTATTDSNGQWVVNGIPSGNVRIEAGAQGFASTVYTNTPFEADRPAQYNVPLHLATTSETVEVTAPAPTVAMSTFEVSHSKSSDDRARRDAKKAQEQQLNAASSNVFDLQKKVAGVLPVRVDVPRAGNSYRFARALVLDEETKVSFNYKTK